MRTRITVALLLLISSAAIADESPRIVVHPEGAVFIAEMGTIYVDDDAVRFVKEGSTTFTKIPYDADDVILKDSKRRVVTIVHK